ncbi:MAG: bifunctional phosphoglucose/phosphomannose isomerase [Candidatus Eisenbacteria sp.]|nr:bifunctional phosphoglucose/phosphomannose isomerase [Candidatus Eisenbacteria bacterium]
MAAVDLDNPQSFDALDTGGMLTLVEEFGEQCSQAIELGRGTPLPESRDFRAVVTLGMGGSAIGGDLLRSCVGNGMAQPWFINRDYGLPRWVGEGTLMLVSSYSGNTEETLAAFEEGISRGATAICLTSGGRLEQLAKERGLPMVRLPGGLPPRAALGYSFFPTAVILGRMGLAAVTEEDLSETLEVIRRSANGWGRARPAAENQAKSMALMLENRVPVIYAGDELLGSVATRWRNQFNENSKILAHSNVFPELNHNEIEGWEGADPMGGQVHLIFLQDQEDSPPIQRRMKVTDEIIGKRAAGISRLWCEGTGRIARVFSLVCLGDFVSVYLALIRGQDPTTIRNINCLKEALANVPE